MIVFFFIYVRIKKLPLALLLTIHCGTKPAEAITAAHAPSPPQYIQSLSFFLLLWDSSLISFLPYDLFPFHSGRSSFCLTPDGWIKSIIFVNLPSFIHKTWPRQPGLSFIIVLERALLPFLIKARGINSYFLQTTVQQKMGLFSLDVPEDNPLAADEDSILEPRPPNVAAHDIWIFFFRERIALAKYTSQYCMESFANMLHDCLSLDIGRQNHISRHPAACGTRFE